MKINGWRYYEHAALPATPPHVNPDITPINSGDIWKIDRTPLLARWTTDFDCGYETNWWYVIKDTPFDINALKAKRRYEIVKGNKNFFVKEIKPADYCEELFRISMAAYETYPKSYRPSITHEDFILSVQRWTFYKTYAAFSVVDGSMCGFSCLNKRDQTGKYINFTLMKSLPEQEKFGLNAAMVYKILTDHEEFLSSGGYINDGARNIQHTTAFQDYLEKYFGFRKAYCTLHIVYRPVVKIVIVMAYPFRKLLKRFRGVRVIEKFVSLLQMEEINRATIRD